MTTLTQAQMDELKAIVESGQSGARVAYYSKLSEFGIAYGGLALGVVLEDQITGRMANDYFMLVAARESVAVSDQQWRAIGNALMVADFDERLAASIVGVDGKYTYPDIDYQRIMLYHQEAFSTLGGTVSAGDGVSINAWTAYAPVTVLGEGVAWDLLLTDDTYSQFGMSAAVWAAMVAAQWSASPSHAELADSWTETIWEARSAITADGSPLAFPVEVQNAYLVLGSGGADTIAADESVAGTKDIMLLGLNGADTITAAATGGFVDAGAGNDHILGQASDAKVDGGAGFDTLSLSSHSTNPTAFVFIDDAFQNEFSGSVLYTSYFDPTVTGETFTHIEAIVGTAGDDRFSISPLSSQGLPTFTIDAGSGDDTIAFNETDRSIRLDFADTIDTVIISEITGPGQVTGNLTGIENVETGGGNDTVYGSAADNTFILFDGFNEGHGRGGADHLYGGAQKDEFHGDGGADVLYGYGGNDDLYGDAGSDNLSGMNGNDRIFGGTEDDWLDGGSDDDWLDGGQGDDDLFGGAGNDHFVLSLGEDFIFDFTFDEDRLAGTFSAYSENEYGEVVVTALEGTAILNGLQLADVQHYDSLGLIWA